MICGRKPARAKRQRLPSGEAPAVELTAEITEQDEAGRTSDRSRFRMGRGPRTGLPHSEVRSGHDQHRLVNVKRPDRAGRLRAGRCKMTTDVLSVLGGRAVKLVQGAAGIVLVCAAASRCDRRRSIRAPTTNSGQRDEEQGGHYRYYPHESKAHCVRLFHNG